ncbi:phosphomannose isomerase type II C-terminal cupin domain [Spirulina sp. 06S082]|uniref:phosphomannose isomerase type II C-terminal cupin domain n=1 Tax=Spirulina sp. 06S082 TaxID=3110248 RepID=UPI002B202D4D|nr:phosphomannose isomerase type II C-terminal cupin domain [Spirulina sp. 06S082]MEA5470164.1 phosphomannose isomerase type II C-terminal cupin domain [Spirulina sp. 06S082]
MSNKPADKQANEIQAGIRVEQRPWGMVTVLEEGSRYRINRIEVKPKHHISTQMHYHRSEHWIVVAGTAKVICDDQETLLMQKQSTYVPMNSKHRVENPGVIPLVMIEVQNGEFLGDEDIIRFPEEESTNPEKLSHS